MSNVTTMRDTEQREMRRTVAGFLDKHSDVRAAIHSEPGFDPALWRRVTGELGLTALLVPERCGGMGLDFTDAAVVLEEFGRRLVPGPLLTTLVAAAVLDTCRTPEADRLLTRIAADGTSVSIAAHPVAAGRDHLTGTVDHVIHGVDTDVLLVVTEDQRLYAVDQPTGHRRTALDHTRALATVVLDRTPGTLLGAGRPVVDLLTDLVLTALAAESAAAASACLDLTVDYLKIRTQFGKPLGTFQALKHRCADLSVTVAGATSTAWYAVRAAAAGSGELTVVAPLAKAVCADALMAVAAESVQLHGGIGFTFEHDAHLYLKRGKANQLLLGSGAELRARVATLIGL
ncbi:acyl-CoA dehydrogenase family protein [Lentzea sp. E54]|uniref:acyl-CoA dehydrogenase family protein n=1 Tax=Lentzea xerophila TaxID=3435883 RepID=UPI003DA61EA0